MEKMAEPPAPPVKQILRRPGSVSGTHRRPQALAGGPGGLPRPILYVMFDVETDGPVPGLFSMLSVGLVGITLAGDRVWECELNLRPVPEASTDPETMAWWQEEAQREAWDHLQLDQKEPETAIPWLRDQLVELKSRYRVFPVAWPASFDWMFLSYYMHRYAGENPLGRRAKCADTYAWCLSRTVHPNVDISTLLNHWSDQRFPHTHCALDDAREQSVKFINMLRECTWNGPHLSLRMHTRKVPGQIQQPVVDPEKANHELK